MREVQVALAQGHGVGMHENERRDEEDCNGAEGGLARRRHGKPEREEVTVMALKAPPLL